MSDVTTPAVPELKQQTRPSTLRQFLGRLGDITWRDSTLSNTGTRSKVYATAGDAVTALPAPGIALGSSC